MNPLATAVSELIALGVEGDALVAAISRMEQSMYVDRAERQRAAEPSKAALRMRRYRENREKNGLPAQFNGKQYQDALRERDGGNCVYCSSEKGTVVDHVWPISSGGTDDIDNLALACHACNCGKSGRTPEEAGYPIKSASAKFAYDRYVRGNVRMNANSSATSSPSSLSRVRDNITNSEIYNNHTTLNCASADVEIVDGDPLGWPEVNPPSRAYLDRLEAALREAGGAALSPISTNLMILAPILALGSPGKGPPCDLQADVLPVIRARSARAKPNSISTWGYFTEAIRQARDNRLAGAPASQEINHERHHAQSAKFDRRQAAHAADFAGSELAVDLRAERRSRYL